MNISTTIFKQALSLYLSRKIMDFAIVHNIDYNQVILVENDSAILQEIKMSYENQNFRIQVF